jgi:hypothetical protein
MSRCWSLNQVERFRERLNRFLSRWRTRGKYARSDNLESGGRRTSLGTAGAPQTSREVIYRGVIGMKMKIQGMDSDKGSREAQFVLFLDDASVPGMTGALPRSHFPLLRPSLSKATIRSDYSDPIRKARVPVTAVN